MNRPVSDELKKLAHVLADWAAPAPGFTVYLFGSRVRDDHKPTSDVDVCFQWGDRSLTQADLDWWETNQREKFATIKAKLPGPLKVLERNDPWWQRIVTAETVYQDRNVRCVWLPPK
jgi:hypothetical protein